MTEAPAHGSVGRPLPGIEVRVVGPDGQDRGLGHGRRRRTRSEPPARTTPDHDPAGHRRRRPRRGRGRARSRSAGRPCSPATGRTAGAARTPTAGSSPATSDSWTTTAELHLVDRAAEAVIVVSGFTVYPREIEDVLAGAPGCRRGRGDRRARRPTATRNWSPCSPSSTTSGRPPTTSCASSSVQRLPAFKHPRCTTWWTRCPGPRSAGSTGTRCVAGSARPPSRRCRRWSPCPTPDPSEHRGADEAEPDPDVTPEPAGDLAELGARLPATGDRAERARDDTDEDLF